MAQDRVLFTMADEQYRSYMIYRTSPFLTTLNDP